MKRDEIEKPNKIVDLFYPDEGARARMKKRRAALTALPQDYIKNLELEKTADLITRQYQYKLLQMLEELCDEPEIIRYRQDILKDFLDIPRLAVTIKKIVGIMVENDRGNIYGLSEPDSFSTLSDAIRAFNAYVECVEIMHKFYQDNSERIRSEGVRRLFDYFEDGYKDEDYNKMKHNLEELDKALKDRIRSVTVGINLDENLVPVSAGVIEYSSKRFAAKPSLFDRILYRGSVPQDKVVENLHKKYKNDDDLSADELLVNTVDETLFRELDSLTHKLVKRLAAVMAEYQRLGIRDIVSIDYQLDFYIGAVSLVQAAEAKGLKMCCPEILPARERRAEIKGLFDLIYYSEAAVYNLRVKDGQKKPVVVNDITVGDGGENAGFYILTGANNGGKTTFVRALGICQVLAQAGLFVPAEACRISVCDFIYTHFPKEEEMGINASRFTTEIKEFKTISDTVTNHSLLLMNESIQSTTPVECIEIASKLVRLFCMLGVRGVFATHLIDVAFKAVELNDTEGLHTRIGSLTVAVDEKTGERKYKISHSMPSGNVYAGEIFEKFGIREEDIAARAAKMEF